MRAKGDKSKRVGGRRKAGPSAPKKSLAKKPRGKEISFTPGGQVGYRTQGKVGGKPVPR